jgi:putative dimethyl sulfoxide reductase chaperone
MSAWIEILAGEMLLFNLIGKAFYAGPDRGWLDSLVKDDVFAESPFGGQQADTKAGLALLQTWSRANADGISDVAFETLQAEYTRLFIGPGPVIAPPWESVYFSQERLLFQTETFRVRAWYGRFGLMVPNLQSEPDDHIGLELSFVAHLAGSALQAIQAHERERFREALEAQRHFLTEHLLKWGPGWCSRVVETSDSEFYRGLALLTRGALSEISERLTVRIPAQPEG